MNIYIYIYISIRYLFKPNEHFHKLTKVYYNLQKKDYVELGLLLSSDSASVEKSYKDTKC
jgi:hypothetical protein